MSLFVATSGSIRHLASAPPCVRSTEVRHPPTVRSSGGTSFEPGWPPTGACDLSNTTPRARPSRRRTPRNRQPYLDSHPNMSVTSAPSATSQLSVAAKAISTVTGHPPIAFRLPSVPSPEQRPSLLPGSATRSCCGSLSSTSMESRRPPTSIARWWPTRSFRSSSAARAIR